MTSEHDADVVVERVAPCPFCGGEAIADTASGGDPGYLITCRKCWVNTGWHDSADQVIAVWNSRTCSHKPGDRLPGGLRVVPEEPSARMLDMGEGFNIRCGCADCDHSAGECIADGYRAMIAAAGD